MYTANVWTMTITTFSRRWGELLALLGLTFGLTATLFTGAGSEQCGTNKQCGYRARCDKNTTQCVCLSDNSDLRTRDGNPNSLFYCLGEGVTECGDKLCGYRAECNTDRSDCRCPFNNAEPRELKGTSPSLWYCVEKCDLKGSVCPDNTTCRDSSGNDRHLCECSEKATLSSTGQCLDFRRAEELVRRHTVCVETKALSSKSTASVGPPTTTTTAGPNENRNVQSDCNALTVGLAVGFGEALCIMVIVVVVVLIRKHWGLKVVELCKSQGSGLQNINSNDNLSAVETGHSYENVESSSSLEESRRSRRTGPRVEIEMDINETDVQPIGDSPAYENVNAPSQSPNDNDNSGLYESVNSRDTSGTRLYTSLVQKQASQ